MAALVDQTIYVGRPLNYDITADIADVDAGERATLAYSVTNSGKGDIPFDWLTFTTTTEAFTGTPLV